MRVKMLSGFTAALFVGCIYYTGLSHGADGTITFSGELGGECSVTTYTESVDYGILQISDFPTVGDDTASHTFTMGISCTDTGTQPYVSFEGEVDSTEPSYFANTGGTAQGIAIRLLYAYQTIIPGAETPLVNVTTAGQTQTYTFGSRLVRTGDLVKGTIEIPVTFTLSFE